MSVNIFDAHFYRAANPDLRGLNDAQAWSHFQEFGLNAGLSFSSMVDLNFYRSSNSDLQQLNNHEAFEHLQNYGILEGRKFSQSFDARHYLDFNPDLQKQGLNYGQAYEHFTTTGLAEGRSASNYIINDSAGNTFETARQIFVDSQSVIFRDGVGNDDQTDIYSFTLENPVKRLNLIANCLNDDINLKLFESGGGLIAQSMNMGPANEYLNIEGLGSGTFFAEVSLNTPNGYTNYHLDLSVLETVSVSETITPQTPTAASSISNLIQDVVNITNKKRTEAGLEPLKFNTHLSSISQAHSQDMALNDFFGHRSSSGSSIVERATNLGYPKPYIGENIAAGYKSAEALVDSWMQSSAHRKNILNPYYREVGIGFYQLDNDVGNVNYNYYWTQNFSV
ncbi:MAG: CAP domain-containing protein [Cyanobacteria bacterium P01_A01_bin.84]